MGEPAGLGQLNSGDWERLQDLASRFEKTCRDGSDKSATANLQAYLPAPGDPLRPIALQELIKVEMEARARRGEAVMLESYLKRYPEMGNARDLPANLIYEEYRTRHVFGDAPALDSYRQRFPDQFEKLQQLVADRPVPNRLLDTIEPLPTTKPPLQQATQPDKGPAQRVVGDYELIRCLGRGTFGEVWQARAPGGVEVAVKIISRPLDDETARRELQALELTKQLRHPFLLQVHRYWQEGDRLCIAMELAEGSLRDRLKECKKAGLPGIPAVELLPYLHESADALDFLHKQHVLHRDVKPDNILVIQQHAKVADFGLAREQQIQGLFSASCSGTPAYMAPEVWAGKVSQHSDQYGLAITYAELRLGRWPFASMAEVMTGNRPNLEPLPADEQKVLLKALSSDSKQRYASCRQFVQALERTVVKEKPAGSSFRRVALCAAVLLLVMGLLAGIWILRPILFPPIPDDSAILLAGCEPAGPETHTDYHGKKYYQQVNRILADGERIPFVLVPKGEKDDPATFYIMVNKVSVGQFRKFTAQSPKTVGSKWNKEAGDDYPALGMTVTEAHHFATDNVQGKLPRVVQWDRAAGFHDWKRKKWPNGPWFEGPFKGKWEDNPKPLVAVDRAATGPMKVGEAKDDESPFGCRDMAGNGREWTRTLTSDSKSFPLAEPGSDDFVRLRGQDFSVPEPFQYQMLLDNLTGICPYQGTLPDVGFRVVLEP